MGSLVGYRCRRSKSAAVSYSVALSATVFSCISANSLHSLLSPTTCRAASIASLSGGVLGDETGGGVCETGFSLRQGQREMTSGVNAVGRVQTTSVHKMNVRSWAEIIESTRTTHARRKQIPPIPATTDTATSRVLFLVRCTGILSGVLSGL
jgi:hypothetical protein